MSKHNPKVAALVPSDGSTLLNQCLNISDYMYYGQYTTYASTSLQDNIFLKPLMVGGKPLEMTNASQGLFAEAFVSTGAGPKHVVIGYEGTDLYDQNNPNSNTFTGGQIVADANLLAGQAAPSFATSVKFASRVLGIAKSMGIGTKNVFVTGHSLGAAEAEYAAASTGLSGYTFGTPGIVAPKNAKSSQLTDFVDYGDPVGNYSNDPPDLYGAFLDYPALILSPSILHYGGTTPLGVSSNADYLDGAIDAYRAGLDVAAAAAFYNALDYHYLLNYEKDLQAAYPNQGINLFLSDGSVGADSNFVNLVTPPDSVVTACYTTGTRIRTPDAERPVEDLAVGDLIVTASGDLRAIVWLGYRTVDCRRHPCPRETFPIRIAAHAFGPDKPTRDLYVSPGHAICVDVLGGVLIPAGSLINGLTIVQVEVESVTYWHVELDAHEIILAESLPAETYLEMGNRTFFGAGDVVALHGNPDGHVPTHADFCRPFVDGGPLHEAVRARLGARAAKLHVVARQSSTVSRSTWRKEA